MSRIYDLGGRPAALSTPAVYALTLGLQADALGLTGVQFATPSATKDGAPIAIVSWAWVVTGPCTLDDDELERPTPTHTGAGTCTRQLVATLADGAVVRSDVDAWQVGDTAGLVTTYAPDLAAVASADWRSGGPAFAVEGVDWTARNVGTFASAGVLGPNGSTGIRMKPSSDGDWLGATTTAGGVDFNLSDAISGLDRNTIFDVVFAVAVAADVASNYDIYGAYVGDNPHTSAPRALLQSRVYNSAKLRKAVRQEPTSTDTHVEVAQTDALRGFAFRVRGQTITYYQTTTAISALPDADFTGWTELGQIASDDRAPTVAAAWTIANLTAGLLAYRVGGTGVDIALTGLWVRATL